MITKNMKLVDVVKTFPGSIEIFNKERIDYCCGGKNLLEDALRENGIDVDSFVSMLNEKIAEYDAKNGSKIDESRYALPIDQLIQVIEDTHHYDERVLLSELDKLINKILIVHFDHHGDELLKVHRLFADLKKELEEHFIKEEKIVFPVMIQIMQGVKDSDKAFSYIKELENEHEAAGDIIKELQQVTRDFTAPKDACPTYVGTYEKLKKLVEDIFMHIYYESAVLFVKVEELVQ
ncbi:iron-sulfur cluster repair di-iron protein [Anaeromicropila herbilytica]|uniref:Iron-sulfur cluster repair di-iron protein n=1 Tax=Anaeromicropila herbilytica TaxID=2785025 RepID=A0A7R7EN26_9FIRM|nr:iron-sulfur cluster repair di-iron protein [Anaeromicropila herbilytica]BCN31812.1 iron-sulfur cluster repair di-iron protein [Anaeromicropila herbilytica]